MKVSYIGHLKVMDEVTIPQMTGKCSLRSKFFGIAATVLMESKVDGFTKVLPAIREVPLGAFTRASVPVTNTTQEHVILAK